MSQLLSSTLPNAALAVSSSGEAAQSVWASLANRISRFFSSMEPAGLWALPAIAAVVLFFLYFWKVSAPRKHSLEWISMAESRPKRFSLTFQRHPMVRKDLLPVLLITAVYAFTAFFQLGNTHAPQSYQIFQPDTVISFSYEEPVTVDEISYFTVIGTGSYTLEYSEDGVNWSALELDQSYNTLLKWKVVDLTATEDGASDPADAITASMFRISADQVDRSEGLWLGELVLWQDGSPLMPSDVEEDGLALFDEPSEWTDVSTYMNSSYFDEIYHARTALEHLNNIYPYEISHPPLGKLTMSLGILMFGMTPLGWRFMGTLFGVLMVPVLYLFLKNLFGKTPVAVCGTCLFAFDFMHLVQTRIATIDSYGVFYILVSYYFMYRWLTIPAGSKLKKSALPLFFCGLFWGMGCSCKWIVVYAGLGLAVLWVLGLIFKHREWASPADSVPEFQSAPAGEIFQEGSSVPGEVGQESSPSVFSGQVSSPSFRSFAVSTVLLSVVFFAVIPAGIYLASYLPYAASSGGISFRNLLNVTWDNQVFMFTYHNGVHSSHPYESHWYQWIFDARPILYYRDLSLSETEGVKSLFASFNNPLVSWAGLLAFVVMILEVIRQKSGKALFILIAILSQFIPWLFIGRTVFAYHYFPTILFLVFAISYMMDRMLERRRACCRLAVYGFTGYAAALYALFYPALIGLYTPLWYNMFFLRWFPTWPL